LIFLVSEITTPGAGLAQPLAAKTTPSFKAELLIPGI
jgi:hypothetical protein